MLPAGCTLCDERTLLRDGVAPSGCSSSVSVRLPASRSDSRPRAERFRVLLPGLPRVGNGEVVSAFPFWKVFYRVWRLTDFRGTEEQGLSCVLDSQQSLKWQTQVLT